MSARLYRRLSVLTAVLLAAAVLPLTGQEPQGKKYALLIGIKRYNNVNFSNLYYTENDVVELAKLLRPQGFAVTLLSDSQDRALQPTRDNLLRHIDAILTKRTREDIVIFGFAGHGLQFEGDRANYFVPCDAEPNDSTTMISLKTLYEKLEDCGAGTKLMFVDACRNQVKKVRFRTGFDGDSTPPPPRGVCALFSCAAGQSALEMNDLQHGLFFYHLLEGLRGKARDADGEVTVLGLAQYTMRNVKRAGFKQTPVLKGEVSDGALARVIEAALPQEVENSIGLKLVHIPSGNFHMGSPKDEEGRSEDEGPQHKVEITRPFYLGVYEVTQAQYERVMGENPSYFSAQGGYKEKVAGLDTRNFPVENVSWEDAVSFCRKLSDLPAEKAAGRVYGLPTEAEWEYACRGGAASYQIFHYGNSLSSTQANFSGEYPYGGAAKGLYLGRTAKVGSYPPNAFGLCDMHGNVWEWCADWYDKDYYRNSDSRDPKGPNSGTGRVLRGGSWLNDGLGCRAAVRNWSAPGVRYSYGGFRVLLRPAPRTP